MLLAVCQPFKKIMYHWSKLIHFNAQRMYEDLRQFRDALIRSESSDLPTVTPFEIVNIDLMRVDERS